MPKRTVLEGLIIDWLTYRSRANKLPHLEISSVNMLAAAAEHGGQIIRSTAGDDDAPKPPKYDEIEAAFQDLLADRPVHAKTLLVYYGKTELTRKESARACRISLTTFNKYLKVATKHIELHL